MASILETVRTVKSKDLSLFFVKKFREFDQNRCIVATVFAVWCKLRVIPNGCLFHCLLN